MLIFLVSLFFVSLAAAIVAYAIYQGRKEPDGEIDGVPYFREGDWISVEILTPAIFRLSFKAPLDRLLQSFGWIKATRINDARLDRDVCIECDDQRLLKQLERNNALLAAIKKALEAGFRIKSNGRRLSIQKSKGSEASEKDLRLLVNLKNILEQSESDLSQRLDPFRKKAFVVKATVFSIIVCSLVFFIDNVTLHEEDLHVNVWQLVGPGLIAGILTYVTVSIVTVFLLRRSSRVSLLKLTLLVLPFFMPMFGIETVSKLNRYLDFSSDVIVSGTIESPRQRKVAKSSPRNYIHVQYAIDGPNLDLPSELRVTKNIYQRAVPGKPIEFRIGSGFFGFPWYREFVCSSKWKQ